MAHCANCHPNHHREQLDLLRGVGGSSVPQSTPNLMFGSRTNCLGCHTEMATTEHAGDVAKATLNGCIACHGDRHADTFEKWKLGLELSQTDADAAYAKANQALKEAKNVPSETMQKVVEILKAAKSDLDLVKRGNGLHNVTYSMEVLDSVTARAGQAEAMLSDMRPPP
jgi:hypothetical protein